MSERLKFMFVTESVEVALRAEGGGVDRIFVDREWLGKTGRQGHLDTHKAIHSLDSVRGLAAALTVADLMVRINPPGPQMKAEVEEALEAGARRLMLPMFNSVDELQAFFEVVARRVPVTPLFETPAALACLPECLVLFGSGDSVHFGLTDLALANGDPFLFQPWARGDLDAPLAACRAASVPFGIGGVAHVGGGLVPAEWVVGEHVRVGSDWVILSRTFCKGREVDFAPEVLRLREVEAAYRAAGPEVLEANHERFVARVQELVA